MNTYFRIAFASVAFLLTPLLPAQKLSVPQKPTGMPPVPVSLDDRRKALDAVFHDYWEDMFKRSPELASLLGDSRYNDQVSNFSAGAYNDQLAREQDLLLRLAVIDSTGFTDEEKQRFDALDQRLEQDQKSADAKEWETPFIEAGGQIAGVEILYPDLAQELTFNTVKDYDDWSERLNALPEVFSEIMQDLSLGMEDGRMPPKPLIEKELAQLSTLAHQKPEDSPLAAPLKQIPSTISAQEQQRVRVEMLDAIGKAALPAYIRFERFLRASYLPTGKDSGASVPRGPHDFMLLMMVVDLRAQAQKALGPKFDVHAFHDKVLNTGLLPLDQFEKQMNAWMESRKAAQ